jgi:hypothetical protein
MRHLPTQNYLGHRDPRHTVHHTRVSGRRFEGRHHRSCWVHVSFGVTPVLSLPQNGANDPGCVKTRRLL